MMHGEQVFLLLLSLGSSAMAQPIYRWADEQGITHYTNDATTVPRGRKAQVTAGDEISFISRPPADQFTSGGDPIPGTAAEENLQPQEDPNIEQQWRRAFQDAYARIAVLEAAIESDRKILERNGGEAPLRFLSSPNYGRYRMWWPDPWYDELRQRIRQNEAELKRAREALNDLERYASHQAVPREWRH